MLKWLLFPFSLAYGVGTSIRNKLFDMGVLAQFEADIPVVAVGNLSVGGTGKTPHVELIYRLCSSSKRVAILSRGYGRKTKGFILANAQSDALEIGDEPCQYKAKFGDEVVVAVCESRVVGIKAIRQQCPSVDLILLDDAFQHRSVKPALSILLTRQNNLYTNDFVLPMGHLREWRKGARRADVIMVSKCDGNLTDDKQQQITQSLGLLPSQQIFFSTIRYGQLYELGSLEKKAAAHANRVEKVLLVTGLADASNLLEYIEQVAVSVMQLNYKDHHDYTSSDVVNIVRIAKENECDIVCSEKDAVKLRKYKTRFENQNIKVFVQPIEIVLLGNFDSFNAIINERIF